MNTLNQDVLIKILSFLPQNDKIKSNIVCQEWDSINRYIYDKPIIVNYKQLSDSSFQKWYDNHPNIKLEIYGRVDNVDFDVLDKYKKIYTYWIYLENVIQNFQVRF